MSHLMTCVDALNCSGQTWLCLPLPVSTVPNTGRNLSNSNYQGFDEEKEEVLCWAIKNIMY